MLVLKSYGAGERLIVRRGGRRAAPTPPARPDVMAETDGACWCLDRADLDQLEATNPAAALGLLRILALDLGAKVTLCAQ